jgi:hypothetical protein
MSIGQAIDGFGRAVRRWSTPACAYTHFALRRVNQSLIDEAAHLSGAQRVLLVLSADGLRIAGCWCHRTRMPKRCCKPLRLGSEAQRTQTVSLRHGPEGAD